VASTAISTILATEYEKNKGEGTCEKNFLTETRSTGELLNHSLSRREFDSADLKTGLSSGADGCVAPATRDWKSKRLPKLA
jgi:hypothetical protein